MKRTFKIIFLHAIVTILIFNGKLMGQSPLRTSGIVLRGTYWNANSDHLIVSVSNSEEVVNVGPAGGWVCFFSRTGDKSFLELNLGAIGEVLVDSYHIDGDDVEVTSILPILLGIRYNVLPMENPSALQPYVAFGAGPYWMVDIHVQDHREANEDVGIRSHLLPGFYGGGGLYFHVASWFAFNFDVKYHFINFNPDHGYSGFEFGMGFSFSWGRYTPKGL